MVFTLVYEHRSFFANIYLNSVPVVTVIVVGLSLVFLVAGSKCP